MRGRWDEGIVPRNFAWIVKGSLAVSERPGGYAPYHRPVRRREEILWLRDQGFSRVVSLLPSTHNLHAYEELGLAWSHVPMPAGADVRAGLAELYPQLHGWLRAGERVLVHQDELSELVVGAVAGYLRWSGLLPEGARAITVTERLTRRQLGPLARTIVTLVDEVPPPDSPFPAAPAAEPLSGAGDGPGAPDGPDAADGPGAPDGVRVEEPGRVVPPGKGGGKGTRARAGGRAAPAESGAGEGLR